MRTLPSYTFGGMRTDGAAQLIDSIELGCLGLMPQLEIAPPSRTAPMLDLERDMAALHARPQ